MSRESVDVSEGGGEVAGKTAGAVPGVCGVDAQFRYTWPGRDEAYICLAHATWLAEVAWAMGLYVQLIPVDPGTAVCSQVLYE